MLRVARHVHRLQRHEWPLLRSAIPTVFHCSRAVALATIFGLKAEQVTIDVVVVSQTEVDTHFGVYERMLAEKLGTVPPIQ
ncbi:hypothetical protein [Cupriavidus pauculus]|uniref:Uncharacterized protein n=1 Tax=Cupriavidus pauculus TaxID=82633 RepID=A0A3G8H987_9BURK|nr:hypothetical protein [Cupriavidus pauculus]AZG17147.1 hypothetical protein EHF44_27125 [Cupriavidus pauculus]